VDAGGVDGRDVAHPEDRYPRGASVAPTVAAARLVTIADAAAGAGLPAPHGAGCCAAAAAAIAVAAQIARARPYMSASSFQE
jgi:hypothetical protein